MLEGAQQKAEYTPSSLQRWAYLRQVYEELPLRWVAISVFEGEPEIL
jgi:hypothetical protein